MKKIIIDTDIGVDVDDALALEYALNSYEIEVLGIVTSYQRVGIKARFAKKLLKLLQKEEVPVYAGIEANTTVQTPNYLKEKDYDFLSKKDLKMKINKKGIEFMQETLKAESGEVSIVSLGPLTNIGELIKKEPNLKRYVKSIYWMGGNLDTNKLKMSYNLRSDMRAAKLLFESNISTVMVTKDAAHTVKIKESEFKNQKLYNMVKKWDEFRGRDWTHVADPMAVFAVKNPESIFGYAVKPVLDVETRKMQCVKEDKSSIFAVNKVDEKKFKTDFFLPLLS